MGVLSLIKSFHFVHIAAYGMNYEEEEKVALIQGTMNGAIHLEPMGYI